LVVNGFVDLGLKLDAGFSILDIGCWMKITKRHKAEGAGHKVNENYG
jgi:hypothetical protein